MNADNPKSETADAEARPETRVLVINAGSSSLKFAAFQEQGSDFARVLSGSIDHIGQPDAEFSLKTGGNSSATTRRVSTVQHAGGVELVLAELRNVFPTAELTAIGHRVVHGGPHFSAPQRVTAELLNALRTLSPFDPEHLPVELELIREFQRRLPKTPQVACFDTAFHHDLPRVAQLLPIPRRYAEAGMRRYGFHGLSYEFLLGELERLGEPAATSGRVILAHLGSGASLAAVRDGRCVDTSMSFTPTAGLVMGTRTGDLDPGVLFYLAQTEKLTAAQLNHLVNHDSGLRGISETSSDMRELLAREHTDARAAEAIELFCYQTKKWIGSFAAVLGGLDALVFSGGIGEHCPSVRARICDGLRFLGVELDTKTNAKNSATISTNSSRVTVRMIPTDEELTIARHVREVISVKTPPQKNGAQAGSNS
jgi:acetate kinase